LTFICHTVKIVWKRKTFQTVPYFYTTEPKVCQHLFCDKNKYITESFDLLRFAPVFSRLLNIIFCFALVVSDCPNDIFSALPPISKVRAQVGGQRTKNIETEDK